MGRRKLADGSLFDTDWQLKEYERLMGEEAAERQARAAKLEHGQCICRRRTIKTRDGFRRIHDQECPKWKPWMLDVVRSRD
jgi:hypothetical protein